MLHSQRASTFAIVGESLEVKTVTSWPRLTSPSASRYTIYSTPPCVAGATRAHNGGISAIRRHRDVFLGLIRQVARLRAERRVRSLNEHRWICSLASAECTRGSHKT